jgi:hypothetical protein
VHVGGIVCKEVRVGVSRRVLESKAGSARVGGKQL